MSKLIASLFAVASLAVGGCWDQNANYCANAPHHNCQDLIDAAVPLCTSDQQCAPNVCDLAGTHTCVQCTIANPAACVATSPVCGADNTCRACTAHSECSSNVCLPDGSCAASDAVAYVAAGKSGTCGIADPCGTLDAALQTGRPYVKFAVGTVKDNKTTTIDGKTVTILADTGAALDRDGDGPILVVQSSTATPTSVQIFDLEITGATGTMALANAIQLASSAGSPSLSLVHVKIDNNQGAGVLATGGALTVSRSVFAQNSGGAISETNGSFAVVGNVFFGNGGISSSTGGISITTTQAVANRLDFNSFASNTTQAGIGPAIDCRAGTFTARNNIMSDNGTLSQPDQFGGSCTHAYSIARPGTPLTGPTNSSADPQFVDLAKGDLHVQPTSPARGGADPTSDLTSIAAHDIDGMARTAPATIGAYQLKAQGAQ